MAVSRRRGYTPTMPSLSREPSVVDEHFVGRLKAYEIQLVAYYPRWMERRATVPEYKYLETQGRRFTGTGLLPMS